MWLYFFPKFEYSRANLYRQQLEGSASKEGASLADLEKAQNNQMGFEWDPEKLIPMEGGQAEAPLGVCGPGPTLPLPSMSSSSAMKPPLSFPTAAGSPGLSLRGLRCV